MEMLRESAGEVDPSKETGDLLGRAPSAIGRLRARIGLKPPFEDARQTCEDGGRIGRAVDDRGSAQPALLAVADIDRGHPDGRCLEDAAGRIADYGIGEPQ